ncbi:MAG: hypothetical protein Q9182_005237 [Xanthomendoza sp. 2 TL-2023]
MAPIAPLPGSVPPADDLDNLFDYHVNLDDVFRDVDVNMDIPAGKQSAQPTPRDDGRELGIDEEVKITKKRQPVPKLDEDRWDPFQVRAWDGTADWAGYRLLSQAGIPKLRRIAKERLVFKGKGHELWLDDLYPRAKFADGLAMIEKLGHKKRIQTMRREWIYHGRPRANHVDMDATQEGQRMMRASTGLGKGEAVASQDNTLQTLNTHSISTPSDEDLYTASPRRNATAPVGGTETLFLSGEEMDDLPPEDDLDALLAETEDQQNEEQSFTSHYPIQQQSTPSRQEHDLEDDMDALAAMDGV